jgi:hypothetical protein
MISATDIAIRKIAKRLVRMVGAIFTAISAPISPPNNPPVAIQTVDRREPTPLEYCIRINGSDAGITTARAAA